MGAGLSDKAARAAETKLGGAAASAANTGGRAVKKTAEVLLTDVKDIPGALSKAAKGAGTKSGKELAKTAARSESSAAASSAKVGPAKAPVEGAVRGPAQPKINTAAANADTVKLGAKDVAPPKGFDPNKTTQLDIQVPAPAGAGKTASRTRPKTALDQAGTHDVAGVGKGKTPGGGAKKPDFNKTQKIDLDVPEPPLDVGKLDNAELDNVLPFPKGAKKPKPDGFTKNMPKEEVDELFRPGKNLTPDEMDQKVDILLGKGAKKPPPRPSDMPRVERLPDGHPLKPSALDEGFWAKKRDEMLEIAAERERKAAGNLADSSSGTFIEKAKGSGKSAGGSGVPPSDKFPGKPPDGFDPNKTTILDLEMPKPARTGRGGTQVLKPSKTAALPGKGGKDVLDYAKNFPGKPPKGFDPGKTTTLDIQVPKAGRTGRGGTQVLKPSKTAALPGKGGKDVLDSVNNFPGKPPKGFDPGKTTTLDIQVPKVPGARTGPGRTQVLDVPKTSATRTGPGGTQVLKPTKTAALPSKGVDDVASAAKSKRPLDSDYGDIQLLDSSGKPVSEAYLRQQKKAGQRLSSALKKKYGDRPLPMMHVTDEASFAKIVKSKKLDNPKGGASWSTGGNVGPMRRGGIAIRAKPSSIKKHFDFNVTEKGATPQFFKKAGKKGTAKNYIDTKHLEYFDVDKDAWLPVTDYGKK